MYVKLMEIGFYPGGFAERHAFDIRDGFEPFRPLSCQRAVLLSRKGTSRNARLTFCFYYYDVLTRLLQ